MGNKHHKENSYSGNANFVSSLFASKEKKEIKINENYEKQTNFPKPIMIEIFSYLKPTDINSVALTCKQFYFVIYSDNFFHNLLNQEFENEEIEKLEGETWTQKFLLSRDFWDKNKKPNNISIKGKQALRTHQSGWSNVLSRKTIVYGEENVLICFSLKYTDSDLLQVGFCFFDSPLEKSIFVERQHGHGIILPHMKIQRKEENKIETELYECKEIKILFTNQSNNSRNIGYLYNVDTDEFASIAVMNKSFNGKTLYFFAGLYFTKHEIIIKRFQKFDDLNVSNIDKSFMKKI